MIIKSLLPLSMMFLMASTANAYYGRQSTIFPDLQFSLESASPATSNSIRNKVFMPQKHHGGSVVLLHSCAGIHPRSEATLRSWTTSLLENGYAVLVVDHLTDRNQKRNCGRNRTVNEGRLVKDLYDATEYLANVPGADPKRIFVLGFSLGAMTGSLAASQDIYEDVAENRLRPRAIAGLYGGCDYGRGNNFLHRDTSLPLLWLMAKDDPETPPESCIRTLNHVVKKVPETTWHVYPNATHCWDCRELDGFSKTAGNGNTVTYLFNEEVTADSLRRVLDFFNRF